MSATRLKLALICDFMEEGWQSMDLFADMILTHLRHEHGTAVAMSRICPPFRRRLTRLLTDQNASARNADRFLNRFWDYPRFLRRLVRKSDFDLFHIVDHSYGQLLHVLPPDRTLITCHDLDAFRCLLEPAREPRPYWFCAMAKRILFGFQKAALVVCNSETTRRAIRAYDLIPEHRLRTARAGISSEFTDQANAESDARLAELIGPAHPKSWPNLLHVGSTIPRKRIDVLLKTFALVRRAMPGARLLKVGGALTPDQERQAQALGIREGIVVLSSLDRPTLAAIYRRADLVLQPSAAEGFGLPVAEAMACGTQVLASDIPALREVGADAAVYCPVGDVAMWSEQAIILLEERRNASDAWVARRAAGLGRAGRFTWKAHVERLLEAYRSLA